MSRNWISPETRAEVAKRADHQCEYCKIPAYFSYNAFHIDHIHSLKLGGSDDFDNLAHSCLLCNQYKGSHVASYSGNPPKLLLLFNPRVDVWEEHFRYTPQGRLEALSETAIGTIDVLKLNDHNRIKDRQLLCQMGIL